MFQKKILVVAVAGALGSGIAGTASAQDSEIGAGGSTFGNVTIYGKLYPQFGITSSSGATPAGTGGLATLAPASAGTNIKSRNSVDSSNSRLGFRGTESLGNGLSAIWQIEQNVSLDTGVGTVLADRTSFVGLHGGFGTVKLGNIDTVYKELSDPMRFFNLASGNFVSTSNIMAARNPFNPTTAGLSNRTGSAAGFHQRRANSVVYDTPVLGGFQGFVLYSPDEIKTGGLNADLQSYGVKFKTGGLDLRVAYEVHNDQFMGSTGLGTSAFANATTGTGPRSKDTATRGTAMYTWGNTRVAFEVASINMTESGQTPTAAGKFQNYKNTRWNLAWEQRWIDSVRTMVQYSSAAAGSCALVSLTGAAACNTNGFAANMLALGAEYSFSKRTALFALYTKLNNGIAGTYNNTENSIAVAPGSDITQWALGVRHDY
jgi:predicted porin